MTPYYSGKGLTLYLGDCADLEVEYDLLLTDPPYGKNYESGKSRGKWGKIKGDQLRNLREVEDRLIHSLTGLRRGRHAYIFGGLLNFSRLPLGGLVELIWDKGIMGMGDLTSPWGPSHEIVTFGVYEFSKANRDKGYGRLAARIRKGSILRSLRPNSGRVKNHPTEKPVDILREMIESSSMIGETVFDPFCGSGSTLIASALEGRKAIGCEIDEKYCEIAVRRFEREIP
jgi:site-specific DNA-methyltransferase (adenine-specific)